jgi:alpha-tubulin suppressor-like RCC1 family protein
LPRAIADSWWIVLQGFDSDVAFAVSRTGDVYVWGKRSGPTGLSPDASVAALVKRTYRDNGLFDSSDEDDDEEDIPAENSPAHANRQRAANPDEDDDDEDEEDEEEGGEEDIVHPVKLSALCGEGVNFIAVGRSHCCAKTKDGDVFTWGRNDHCQLGDEPQHALSQAQSKKARSRYGRDRLEPLLWERTIPQLDKVVAAVAAGTNHTFAVTSAGETLAFGATFRSGESSALARSLAKLHVTQVAKA